MTIAPTLERDDVEASAVVEMRRLNLSGVEQAVAREQRRAALDLIRRRYMDKGYEDVDSGEVIGYGQTTELAEGPYNTPHRSGRRPKRT